MVNSLVSKYTTFSFPNSLLDNEMNRTCEKTKHRKISKLKQSLWELKVTPIRHTYNLIIISIIVKINVFLRIKNKSMKKSVYLSLHSRFMMKLIYEHYSF